MSIHFKRIKATLDFLDTLPVGQYQGKTVSYVLEFDPAYLTWLVKTAGALKLNAKCLAALEDRLNIAEFNKLVQSAKKVKRQEFGDTYDTDNVDFFADWDMDIHF